MKRILIVDDHPIVRDGLKQILAETEDLVVGAEAGNADDALALVRESDWDLVVLDITLPGRTGIDLLRDLRRERPLLPVLILSIHSEDELGVRAVKAGASGYLSKECASDDLVRAIQLIVSGNKYISRSLAERLIEEIQRDTNKPPHETLSDREYEVMALIAAGKSMKEVGAALSLSKSTVSTYRQRVFDKLKVRSNAEITRYALHHGLVT
ncbi:MAG: response regulator transcription factor [Acidobacteriota bacterium]|nr:response regulator transcription factor [Acidobacteriota bacterium]MDQ5871189.1 response regulator transcription factor [Acidobacteriota bacterium]